MAEETKVQKNDPHENKSQDFEVEELNDKDLEGASGGGGFEDADTNNGCTINNAVGC